MLVHKRLNGREKVPPFCDVLRFSVICKTFPACWRSKGVYNEDQALILWTQNMNSFSLRSQWLVEETLPSSKCLKRKCFAAKRSLDLLKLKLFDVSPQRQMFDAKSLNLLKCSRVRSPGGEAVVNWENRNLQTSSISSSTATVDMIFIIFIKILKSFFCWHIFALVSPSIVTFSYLKRKKRMYHLNRNRHIEFYPLCLHKMY